MLEQAIDLDKDIKDIDKYTVKTVERAFQILDCFWENGPQIGVTEVCNKLGINSNMAFRLLMTMEKAGYISQDPSTNKFQLTLKVLQLSRVALNAMEIRRQSMPYLEALSREYRAANVNLAVYEQGEVISIARFESEKVPRTYFHIGRRLPAHATGVGKILISELDDAELESVVNTRGLKKYTEKTISTLEELKKELEKVRHEGLAWDIEEHIPGVNCVAAPIRDGARRIIASVSLSAFEIHISLEELKEASVRLRETANSISHVMGFYSDY
ncbi:MAG: IclR family transcriptional regulator [Firmicutes bacterium]|nr:IclR family transcriptional regulator [Bacillota bacterium]